MQVLGWVYLLCYAYWIQFRFDRDIDSDLSVWRPISFLGFHGLNLVGIVLERIGWREVHGWNVVFLILACGAAAFAYDQITDAIYEDPIQDLPVTPVRKWLIFAGNFSPMLPALWLNYRVAFG